MFFNVGMLWRQSVSWFVAVMLAMIQSGDMCYACREVEGGNSIPGQ